MADRTTKLLLLAIAIGLWMNVATQWLRPVAVHAAAEVAQNDTRTLRNIESTVDDIHSQVSAIWGGFCANPKIC